jgi:excisionase family DNA binding protein
MTPLDSLYTSLVADITAEVERRVLERLQSAPAEDKRMNAQEAADYLGISRRTLYVLCSEKQIRYASAGAAGSTRPAYIFRQSTLDAWLRQREEESITTEGA